MRLADNPRAERRKSSGLGRYIVFACPRCGVPRYAGEGQKTAKCFYCGLLIRLDSAKIRILLRTGNLRAAREAVEEYKLKRRILRMHRKPPST